MVIRSKNLNAALESQKMREIPHHIVFEGPFEDFDRWDNAFKYWIVAIKNDKGEEIKTVNFRNPDRAEEYAFEQSRELNIELFTEALPAEEYRS